MEHFKDHIIREHPHLRGLPLGEIKKYLELLHRHRHQSAQDEQVTDQEVDTFEGEPVTILLEPDDPDGREVEATIKKDDSGNRVVLVAYGLLDPNELAVIPCTVRFGIVVPLYTEADKPTSKKLLPYQLKEHISAEIKKGRFVVTHMPLSEPEVGTGIATDRDFKIELPGDRLGWTPDPKSHRAPSVYTEKQAKEARHDDEDDRPEFPIGS